MDTPATRTPVSYHCAMEFIRCFKAGRPADIWAWLTDAALSLSL